MKYCKRGLTSGALQGKRVFFSADAKLPKDTPEPVAELRKIELLAIQVRSFDYSQHVLFLQVVQLKSQRNMPFMCV